MIRICKYVVDVGFRHFLEVEWEGTAGSGSFN